jgi:hypothetical protein
MRPPLQVTVIFQASPGALKLASELFRTLAGGPDDSGLRVPVRFHTSPDLPVDMDAADHSLVVVLIDGAMARRVGSGAPGERWAGFVTTLLASTPPATASHAVLPVALDDGAFTLDEEHLALTSFVRLDVVPVAEHSERLLFHAATAALRLLQGHAVTAGTSSQAPMQIFVSHAKPDLPRDSTCAGDADPVRCILLELAQGPVDGWFDAKKIPRGGRFDHEIHRGVLDASAMIAVVTNHWSDREWCRREVLEAKEARRPLLIVDYITDEKPRLFPYLGNAPVMRWRDAGSARKAVTFAVREALRYAFHLKALEGHTIAGDVVFGTKPELLSVVRLPAGTSRIVYPDPPLGEEELVELRRVAPGVRFTTPLSEVAAFSPPAGRSRVALSLSASPDPDRYGASPDHLALLAADINLYLFLAGFTVAFGGKLGPDGLGNEEVNFTERLFSVARSYSPYARQLGRPTTPVIVNYAAWPIHRMYGAAEHGQYRRLAELVEVPRPADLVLPEAGLGIDSDAWFPPTSPGHRFAWARGLTVMREAMRDAADIGARIVLGGKLTGYLGRYPGLVEESLLDLRARRPLFLVGAVGGAARLVLDALRCHTREELTTAWVMGATADGGPRVPFYATVRQLHLDRGLEFKTPEELAAEFADLGRTGLGAALNNGLTDEQNETLAKTTDPHEIVQLVVRGLRNLNTSPSPE